MIHPRPFLMVRHGQSEANVRRVYSGHIDVALTELGREQARTAARLFATLPDDYRPRRIVHSNLSRARDTAGFINAALGGLPMREVPDFAEQNFGEWEGQSVDLILPRMMAGEDPATGETRHAFRTRVRRALNETLMESADLPLIVCHGGVFHAFMELYQQKIDRVENCAAYRFSPRNHDYPWEIACITASA